MFLCHFFVRNTVPMRTFHLLSIDDNSAIYLRIAQLGCICTVVHFTACSILVIITKNQGSLLKFQYFTLLYTYMCMFHLFSIGDDSAIYLRIALLGCICIVVHFTSYFILVITTKNQKFSFNFYLLAHHMYIWWKVYNNMVIEWIWWNMNPFWPDNALTSLCIIWSELVHISPYPFNKPILPNNRFNKKTYKKVHTK